MKPGDTVKAEDALVTLESDKATMDVPAPLGGVVREHRGQGRRQGERRRADADAGHGRGASGARHRAAAPPRPAAPPAPRRRRRRERRAGRRRRSAHSRSPTPVPACASSRASSASTSATVKGTGDKGRILKEDVEAAAKGGRAARTPAPAAAGGGVGGIDLLPWPKVDFAKFGPIEAQAAVADQEDLRREPAPQLGDDPARHQSRRSGHHRPRSVPRRSSTRRTRRAGVKVTMLAFMIKARGRGAQEVPGLQRLARRRQPGPEEVLPHRLRRRHAERPRRAGDPRRRPEGRASTIAKEMGELSPSSRATAS